MPTEDQNSPGPMAGDGPATCRHCVKSVVKTLEKLAPAESAKCAKVKPWIKPVPPELASCGRGRGRIIAERLQELAGMGPVANPHHTDKEESPAKKPTFPTPEEREECRQRQE